MSMRTSDWANNRVIGHIVDWRSAAGVAMRGSYIGNGSWRVTECRSTGATQLGIVTPREIVAGKPQISTWYRLEEALRAV